MSDRLTQPLAPEEWDAAVTANSGHFLQSWRWGEFKSRFGWQVDHVSVREGDLIALAQVLYQRRGPVSVGYIPRGPVLPDGNDGLAARLLSCIDNSGRAHRALYTLVEANGPLPFSGRFKDHGFVSGPEHIQPARTVKIELADDDRMLAQMRQNTRYSVRLAMRRGVEVVCCGDGYEVADFYQLLLETSDRNRFGIHGQEYYREFLRTFGDDALCVFARIDDNLAAALIAIKYGAEAIYMYGASSSQFRAHGAAFLLQFKAMQWAREAGCQRYDLWGIPLQDPDNVSDTGDAIASTKGDDWRGLYRFKTGFGGEIVAYPPMLERRYSQVGSWLVRRFVNRQRRDT